MLYFCSTSVFHVVIILYLFRTVYKNDTRIKKLILLDSVKGLMQIKEALEKSRLFDEIIILQSEDGSPEALEKQTERIRFGSDDIYHMFGMEPYSISLLKKSNRITRSVVVEEGMLWFCELEKTIIDYNIRQKEAVFQIKMSDIPEVWKLGKADAFSADHVKCEDLQMPERINDDAFRKEFIAVLEKIFSREDARNYYNRNIIFDSYLRQVLGGFTRALEIELLRETVNSFGNNEVWIKPHPGENDISKYETVTDKICEKSYIPWEVIHLFEWEAEGKIAPKILLSFYPTGAMIDEEFLFKEKNVYIIYLYRLYQRLGVNISDFNRFRYIEEDTRHTQNVFLPETFAELKKIIESIHGKELEETRFHELFQKEQEYFLRWFIEEYQKNLSLRPLEKNITTLFGIDNKVPEVQEELELDTTIEYEEFEFKVKDIDLTKYRWYIVRERKVNIYEIHIYYENINGERKEISRDKIHFLNRNEGQQRWIEFLDFDSCVDIEVEEPCNKIIIRADMKFDDNYSNIVGVSRTLTRHFGELMQAEIRERDALHREINNRDELIKDIVRQREEINVILVSERRQFEQEIIKERQQRENANAEMNRVRQELEKLQKENSMLNKAVLSFRNYLQYKKNKNKNKD